MAQIPGTLLIDPISPGDTSATFPTHVDIYGMGGLMSVQTLSELSTGIPAGRQKVGMMIYVTDTSSYYTLTSVSYPLTSFSPVSQTFSTKDYTHANFYPLTGNATITGPLQVNSNVLIYGNLSATGTSNFSNTIFSTTTALSVVHTGDGPAMWVGNSGTGDIASFYDIDQGVEVLHVAGTDGTFPGVGIRTSTPNKALTVNGEISANNVIYDANGNSLNWNNVYSSVASTSSNWNEAYNAIDSYSSNWVRSYFINFNDELEKYAYYGKDDAGFSPLYGPDGESWTRWFANFGTGVLSGENYDNGFQIYVNPNEIKKIYYDGTQYVEQSVSYLSNSRNWDSVFATVSTLSASWEESADILPTVTNYLSTNNVLLSSATIQDTLSASSYVNNPTGKTIYVDSGVGTNTRTELSKYDSFKPFATISAAVAASVTGDLIYVRAGAYSITAQINLNLKGHLYFAPGATVGVLPGVVAFSYSQNSIPIYIRGAADFVLAGTAGVLTIPSGSTAAVAFECNTVSGPSSAPGTLFNCAAGALSVDIKVVQMTDTFTASNATVFNITGVGKVTTRIPFVYCGVFVNGAGAENPGGTSGAQINADIWTLFTYNTTSGMILNRVITHFRIVNYNHVGVGAALSWTEDTTVESHAFQGIAWNSVGFQPHITFASTAGTTNSKRIRLHQSNTMRGASTNSLSSNVAINVGTHSTFASMSATSNITFKVGSFTVDSDVNTY